METNFNPAFASDLIKRALDAGLVKLNGPGSTELGSAENAKVDAKYFLELYRALTGKSGND